MKKLLVLLASMAFVATANAELEIQINGSALGTSSTVNMVDSGVDGADMVTTWGVGGEVYYGLNDNIQVGGLLNVDGDSVDGSDTGIAVGVMGRYNLDSDLRDSMFFNVGFSYYDKGSDSMRIHAGFGKRFALSDTITYTPNFQAMIPVAGDNDKGYTLSINLISFSGFMDM